MTKRKRITPKGVAEEAYDRLTPSMETLLDTFWEIAKRDELSPHEYVNMGMHLFVTSICVRMVNDHNGKLTGEKVHALFMNEPTTDGTACADRLHHMISEFYSIVEMACPECSGRHN